MSAFLDFILCRRGDKKRFREEQQAEQLAEKQTLEEKAALPQLLRTEPESIAPPVEAHQTTSAHPQSVEQARRSQDEPSPGETVTPIEEPRLEGPQPATIRLDRVTDKSLDGQSSPQPVGVQKDAQAHQNQSIRDTSPTSGKRHSIDEHSHREASSSGTHGLAPLSEGSIQSIDSIAAIPASDPNHLVDAAERIPPAGTALEKLSSPSSGPSLVEASTSTIDAELRGHELRAQTASAKDSPASDEASALAEPRNNAQEQTPACTDNRLSVAAFSHAPCSPLEENAQRLVVAPTGGENSYPSPPPSPSEVTTPTDLRYSVATLMPLSVASRPASSVITSPTLTIRPNTPPPHPESRVSIFMEEPSATAPSQSLFEEPPEFTIAPHVEQRVGTAQHQENNASPLGEQGALILEASRLSGQPQPRDVEAGISATNEVHHSENPVDGEGQRQSLSQRGNTLDAERSSRHLDIESAFHHGERATTPEQSEESVDDDCQSESSYGEEHVPAIERGDSTSVYSQDDEPAPTPQRKGLASSASVSSVASLVAKWETKGAIQPRQESWFATRRMSSSPPPRPETPRSTSSTPPRPGVQRRGTLAERRRLEKVAAHSRESIRLAAHYEQHQEAKAVPSIQSLRNVQQRVLVAN